MTMTNDNDDEEKFLVDKVLSARENFRDIKTQMCILQMKYNSAKSYMEACEQAAIDYMIGNGCIETENFRIKKTQVVDVQGEFPDEYARIKREPDKRKIAIEKPQANWYTMKENTYIQLVGDKRGI
jgi:hypothetical protein